MAATSPRNGTMTAIRLTTRAASDIGAGTSPCGASPAPGFKTGTVVNAVADEFFACGCFASGQLMVLLPFRLVRRSVSGRTGDRRRFAALGPFFTSHERAACKYSTHPVGRTEEQSAALPDYSCPSSWPAFLA